MAKTFGPQVGLGMLALISLFGVMRIAKKAQGGVGQSKSAPMGNLAWAGAGGPGVSLVGDEPLAPLGGSPKTVGEATEIDGVMVGHEVDERTVRVQQIAKQIGQMIKEDPVVAAGIVQHWLAEEK
jgi:flagellar biosynthesis/type III secretory pathway M-ring protein FliF/YscJ